MIRLSRPRTSMLRGLTGATVLAVAITASVPVAAQADVACTEPALIAAITTANGAGGGNVVLTPGCTYTLTSSHSTGTQGPNGLPIITTAITLTGNANVIARAALALPFRIVEVSNTGQLTVKSTMLSNGAAVSGGGGGILNYGAATLTASPLSNNTALLGDGGGLSNVDTPAGTAPAATFTGSTVSNNVATVGKGGGIYNGQRSTLTVTSSPVNNNTSLVGQGGGIAAVNSTATSLTSSPVSANLASLGSGGIYRLNGTMTINTSPITLNNTNNCVGSVPAVPSCTA